MLARRGADPGRALMLFSSSLSVTVRPLYISYLFFSVFSPLSCVLRIALWSWSPLPTLRHIINARAPAASLDVSDKTPPPVRAKAHPPHSWFARHAAVPPRKAGSGHYSAWSRAHVATDGGAPAPHRRRVPPCRHTWDHDRTHQMGSRRQRAAPQSSGSLAAASGTAASSHCGHPPPRSGFTGFSPARTSVNSPLAHDRCRCTKPPSLLLRGGLSENSPWPPRQYTRHEKVAGVRPADQAAAACRGSAYLEAVVAEPTGATVAAGVVRPWARDATTGAADDAAAATSGCVPAACFTAASLPTASLAAASLAAFSLAAFSFAATAGCHATPGSLIAL